MTECVAARSALPWEQKRCDERLYARRGLLREAFMPEDQAKVRDKTESRLERARSDLLAALNALRAGTLSTKEADAVEAAIEDELIALRVGLLCGRG